MSEKLNLPENPMFEEGIPVSHDMPAMLEGHIDMAPTRPKKVPADKVMPTSRSMKKFLNANTSTGTSDGVDWRHKAACLEEDPELFFPMGNRGPALLQIEEAKAVCRRCPVAATCLKWAMDTGQHDGVWGGMSEDERRSLKRREGRAVRIRDSQS